jgi:hypothetical protein
VKKKDPYLISRDSRPFSTGKREIQNGRAFREIPGIKA